ncbi:rhamnogalacturonan acetylesterase [Echinicola strongylocentroti]|uniref:Rhamnogalacturonan acetylesterase n=1 Tax=Echinicola strongylocentroti TaxID=1795355 RepID=A0A2Z4ILD5_9BACT|nr:GDSL-type esterase/lipase family protein [Echinicola strongylocentroti]AWW31193.1 rhamnogalacturonan acetylesterase [Echinicola strongylocentroti]
MRSLFFLAASLLLLTNLTAQTYKFDFGNGAVANGYKQVLPDMAYSADRGFGFLESKKLEAVDRQGNALKGDLISSDEPFFFTVDVPEGNYDVKVILGDKAGTSSTTIRVENRRLMLDKTDTKRGEQVKELFSVHVRYPEIAGTDKKVRLKSRELAYFHWDHQLTIEFNGDAPKVAAVEITPNTKAPTVFLAGNSTVVDQANEPWAAWGQMFPVFFKPSKAVIANHAESGETLKAFKGAGRLENVLSLMKPGDYLFIEFAHNDQKPGGSHVEPFTTYQEMIREYAAAAKAKGGIPVLVTSMHRRRFDENGKIINTLDDYPEAMRQLAKEDGIALIDLNAMSKVLYEAWGVEASKKAFVHFPAGTFEGQSEDFADNTHFSTYGAYQLARCVVEGLKQTDLKLKKYLKKGIPSYDPANPPSFEDFYWPLSPKVSVIKPDGN